MRNVTLYQPFPSKNKKNKFSVYVMSDKGRPKLINFGARGYGDYKSGTAGEKQRVGYLARAKAVKNKKGELVYKNKDTPAYWSYHYLWEGK